MGLVLNPNLVLFLIYHLLLIMALVLCKKRTQSVTLNHDTSNKPLCAQISDLKSIKKHLWIL